MYFFNASSLLHSFLQTELEWGKRGVWRKEAHPRAMQKYSSAQSKLRKTDEHSLLSLEIEYSPHIALCLHHAVACNTSGPHCRRIQTLGQAHANAMAPASCALQRSSGAFRSRSRWSIKSTYRSFRPMWFILLSVTRFWASTARSWFMTTTMPVIVVHISFFSRVGFWRHFVEWSVWL